MNKQNKIKLDYRSCNKDIYTWHYSTKFKENISNTVLALYDKYYMSGNIEFEDFKTKTLSRKALHSKKFKYELNHILGINEI